MADDPYDLNRFVEAQSTAYAAALSELQRGKKRSHWMWYIFPQLVGLGVSQTAQQYAIRGLEEARAYLAHPVLGPRLEKCAEVVLGIEEKTAPEIFGNTDAMKLRSCATLFAQVPDAGPVFERLLDKYYEGEPDPRTLELLARKG